ncbi:hypothetical protein GCM10010425_59220 [Streptomyces spororaveus]|uniref:Uncharacterized protein n=1 Tax=Streptomyces spororaveus TaxID=284039 RepID=A0ABQ3T752_9ACTN|nr:hypothetical protein Sspor_17680 [Streptomyces spororaveus]
MLSASTPPHSGELEALPAAGAGRSAAAHGPIPGHLLGYCSKTLDYRRATSKRPCANCAHLTQTLEALRRRAGELALPAAEACHSDDSMLWTPHGAGHLTFGPGHGAPRHRPLRPPTKLSRPMTRWRPLFRFQSILAARGAKPVK